MTYAAADLLTPATVNGLLLLGFRLGGVLLIAPVFSSRTVPMMVRTSLLVVLTWLVTRVVFVCDASGSMEGRPKLLLIGELKETLGTLKPIQFFNVIFFQWDSYAAAYDDGLKPGSPRFKQQTYDFLPGWLNGFGLSANYTYVDSAITLAPSQTNVLTSLERPLAVHAVVGEEDGGLGAFATLRRGHRGDVAVITEPTGAKLITATAGALTFRLEVTGRSAHGSMRKEGVSAWEAFLPVYRALVDLEAERNSRPDREFVGEVPYALSFGILQAGEWSSSVPDKLVAEGRYGVQIGEDPMTARIAFEDVVNDVAVKDPWLHDHRPVVTWPGGQFASGWLDEGHSLGDEMTDAVTALGKPAPAQAAGVYGSDLRLYTGIGGVPSLHYGPGDFRLAHAPMEYVDLEELADVTRALIVLAMRRCGAHR